MNDFNKDGKGKILLALLSVYFIWGSTYLAIRLALEGTPAIYDGGHTICPDRRRNIFISQDEGHPIPTRNEWIGGSLVGGLLLLGGNGGVAMLNSGYPQDSLRWE